MHYLYSSHLCCIYYYRHFADDEIEAQKGKSTCPSVSQHISGRTGIPTQVYADESSYPPHILSLNPQAIPGGRDVHESHCTVRETKAQHNGLPKAIQLMSDRIGFHLSVGSKIHTFSQYAPLPYNVHLRNVSKIIEYCSLGIEAYRFHGKGHRLGKFGCLIWDSCQSLSPVWLAHT